MSTIRPATVSDAASIREIAYRSWPLTYAFLEKAQVDYMLSVFYDVESLSEMILSNDQKFIVLEDSLAMNGFAAYSRRSGQEAIFKLNKLYLLPETKGRGWGRELMQKVEDLVKNEGGHVLELNVNRYNPSRDFYSHLGYEVVCEENIPIGDYWMNDFVMRKVLISQPPLIT
jgi:GNAT superfamily N-acetyltransferase